MSNAPDASGGTTWGDVVREVQDRPVPITESVSAPVPVSAPEPVPVQEFSVSEPIATPADYGPLGYTGTPYPGVTPASTSSSSSAVLKALVGILVLAAVGGGSYWGTSKFLGSSEGETARDSVSEQEPTIAAAPVPEPVPPAPIPAPTLPIPGSGPAAAPRLDEIPERQQMYLGILTPRLSEMVITDPAKLVELGMATCTYLGTQPTGSPQTAIANLRSMLMRLGATSDDGLKIASSSVVTICPQHKSKIAPG